MSLSAPALLAAQRGFLLGLRDALDTGGPATLVVYTSTQPSAGADPGGAPLLDMVAPAFTMHATLASMNITVTGNALRSGQPTWVRMANGTVMLDLAAGLPGSGAPVEITDGQDPPSLQMWTGGELTLTITLNMDAP